MNHMPYKCILKGHVYTYMCLYLQTCAYISVFSVYKEYYTVYKGTSSSAVQS